MAEEKIKALSFKVDEVGKYMKGSKKRFEWVVGLNNRTHTIILDFSFISGKVKAYVDGRVLLQNQIPLNTSFQHPFTLDGFALNLIQQGQNCELRINNKVFSHLYTQERTMQQFKKDDSEFGIQMSKDFMSKISGTGQNKITLDIGGQKKGNFKKNKAEDDGDWGGFGDIGVPEGFQLPPGMAADSKPKTNINSFGTEFDAPPKQQPQQPIDFFGDDQPAQPVKATVPAQTSLIDNDLLGQPTQTQQKNSNPQPSISSLYQQTNMMNTNQLLFNTNLHQQQAAQQGSFNINSQASNPGIGLTMGQSLPFNTMGQPQTMFTTGINTQNYVTGMPSLGVNPTTQSLTGMELIQQTNPNYQINAGYQTGSMNLNQLYQTNQAQMGIGIGQQLPTVEQKTQQLQHAGLMFPTGVANPTVAPSVGFNTTVNTQGKDLFDLM